MSGSLTLLKGEGPKEESKQEEEEEEIKSNNNKEKELCKVSFLRSHTKCVRAVASSPQRDLALSVSDDGSAIIWKIPHFDHPEYSCEEKEETEQEEQGEGGNEKKQKLVKLKIFDSDYFSSLHKLDQKEKERHRKQRLVSCCFSKKGDFFVIGSSTGLVYVFCSPTFQFKQIINVSASVTPAIPSSSSEASLPVLSLDINSNDIIAVGYRNLILLFKEELCYSGEFLKFLQIDCGRSEQVCALQQDASKKQVLSLTFSAQDGGNNTIYYSMSCARQGLIFSLPFSTIKEKEDPKHAEKLLLKMPTCWITKVIVGNRFFDYNPSQPSSSSCSSSGYFPGSAKIETRPGFLETVFYSTAQDQDDFIAFGGAQSKVSGLVDGKVEQAFRYETGRAETLLLHRDNKTLFVSSSSSKRFDILAANKHQQVNIPEKKANPPCVMHQGSSLVGSISSACWIGLDRILAGMVDNGSLVVIENVPFIGSFAGSRKSLFQIAHFSKGKLGTMLESHYLIKFITAKFLVA